MKDIDLAVAAIVLFFGFLGMWAHFLQERRRGKVTGTFTNYLFTDSPGSTGITVGAFLGAMGGLFSLGTFDQVALDAFWEALKNGYLYAPMASAVSIAFMTGFGFDSMMNTGITKPVSAEP